MLPDITPQVLLLLVALAVLVFVLVCGLLVFLLVSRHRRVRARLAAASAPTVADAARSAGFPSQLLPPSLPGQDRAAPPDQANSAAAPVSVVPAPGLPDGAAALAQSALSTVPPGVSSEARTQPMAPAPTVTPAPTVAAALSAVKSSAVAPSAVAPSAVAPSAAESSAVELSVVQPSAAQPGAVDPDVVTAVAAESGAVEPGVEESGAGGPGAGEPGAVGSGAAEPASAEPGAAAQSPARTSAEAAEVDDSAAETDAAGIRGPVTDGTPEDAVEPPQSPAEPFVGESGDDDGPIAQNSAVGPPWARVVVGRGSVPDESDAAEAVTAPVVLPRRRPVSSPVDGGVEPATAAPSNAGLLGGSAAVRALVAARAAQASSRTVRSSAVSSAVTPASVALFTAAPSGTVSRVDSSNGIVGSVAIPRVDAPGTAATPPSGWFAVGADLGDDADLPGGSAAAAEDLLARLSDFESGPVSPDAEPIFAAALAAAAAAAARASRRSAVRRRADGPTGAGAVRTEERTTFPAVDEDGLTGPDQHAQRLPGTAGQTPEGQEAARSAMDLPADTRAEAAGHDVGEPSATDLPGGVAAEDARPTTDRDMDANPAAGQNGDEPISAVEAGAEGVDAVSVPDAPGRVGTGDRSTGRAPNGPEAAGSEQSVAAAVAAAFAVRDARGRSADGGRPADLRGDDRDRLLAVLLDDPVRAVGAAVDLQTCLHQLKRLTEAVVHEQEAVGDALRRLSVAGLQREQIARMSGLSGDDLEQLLPADPTADSAHP